MCVTWNVNQKYLTSISDYLMAVHRPLPPSCIGRQPRGYYRCVRERLKQVHGKVLFEKKKWAEGELIIPLVNGGAYFHAFRKLMSMLNWFDRPTLILYRELHIIVMSIPVFLSPT